MRRANRTLVGVDLGGTSLRALVVDSKNKVLSVVKTPTKRSARSETLIEDIVEAVREAVKAAGLHLDDIAAVSVGAPGAIDTGRGIVRAAPNLGWKDVALGAELKRMLGLPVLVDNDVNVGVVGEHALGAARGAQTVVGIFVGTGIGGGLIVRGRLFEGSRGAAGEVGHMVLEVDGPRCPCGRRGCAEALASRTAMERDVRAAIKAGKKSVVLKIMKDRHRARMTSSVIARALRRKDPVMRKVVKRAQRYLGILVASVVNLLDPEVVVIGGGVTERLGEAFVAPIRRTAYEYFLRRRDAKRVKIVPGTLGDDAGALGAVVLARQRLFAT
jgi:glucokinase